MFKNTVLYHRMWYLRKRNTKRINIYISILLIFIILSTFAAYAENRMMPYIINAGENAIKTTVTSAAAAEMNRVFNENIKYEDVVHIVRNSVGDIVSVDTNVALLNRLSSEISREVQQQLSITEKIDIGIPAGILLGRNIFAAEGPELRIKVIPYRDATVDFISDFINVGENRTRYRMDLQIKAILGLALPFIEKRHELYVTIPVIDTVIMGRLHTDYNGR